MKAIGVAARKWGTAAVLLSVSFLSMGRIANAQVVPPAQTIPEAPSLQNETLKPLDYRNKYDIYGGFASSHFNAGPALIPGANLGGFDIQGTMWVKMRIGVTANIRGYYGTTGVIPNPYNIHGPFVYEHQFMGGPSIRGPKNEHAALTFHALVGGSYGVFDSALNAGVTGPELGLFNNGFALATALGGSRRSEPQRKILIAPLAGLPSHALWRHVAKRICHLHRRTLSPEQNAQVKGM